MAQYLNSNYRIGYLIKELRLLHKLTQEELAEKVQVSVNKIKAWELGFTSLTEKNLVELSTILGVTTEELQKGEIKKTYNKQSFKLNGRVTYQTEKKIFKYFLIAFIPYLIAFVVISILMSVQSNNVNLDENSLMLYYLIIPLFMSSLFFTVTFGFLVSDLYLNKKHRIAHKVVYSVFAPIVFTLIFIPIFIYMVVRFFVSRNEYQSNLRNIK